MTKPKPTTKAKSAAKSKAKRPVGRPKVDIDWDKVGKMLEAGATAEGIAATIGIDRSQLYRRCEADNNVVFTTFSQEKRAKGDELLRTKQFQVAMSGDKTMLIWLGKQRLGQAEKTINEHSGIDGGVIQTESTVNLKNLSTEELIQLKALQKKIKA